MKKLFIILLLAAGIITMPSCRPGVTVTDRPNPPSYARPMAPGPRYVWVDGDWVVSGGRYHWREGYWAPVRNKHWASGHWAPPQKRVVLEAWTLALKLLPI